MLCSSIIQSLFLSIRSSPKWCIQYWSLVILYTYPSVFVFSFLVTLFPKYSPFIMISVYNFFFVLRSNISIPIYQHQLKVFHQLLICFLFSSKIKSRMNYLIVFDFTSNWVTNFPMALLHFYFSVGRERKWQVFSWATKYSLSRPPPKLITTKNG